MKLHYIYTLLTIFSLVLHHSSLHAPSKDIFNKNDIYAVARELTLISTLALFKKLTSEEKEEFQHLVNLEVMAYSLIEQQELEKSLQETS